MSPAQVPQPLPECAMCEAPTRRETHQANGGLCSSCSRAAAAAAALFILPRHLANPFRAGAE